MPQKSRTLEQVEAMGQKAIRFLENVVRDPDKVAEFEGMTPQEYAERKHIQIKNLSGIHREGKAMANKPTRAHLEQYVEELEEQVSDLNERLDSISELAATGDGEAEDDEEDED